MDTGGQDRLGVIDNISSLSGSLSDELRAACQKNLQWYPIC